MCEMVWFDSESIMRLELFDTPTPPPPLRLGPMNSCSSSSQSVRPSVCLQQTFVAICSSAFTKILHSNRNLETERSDESVFSRTIFVLNLAKRVQNVVFLSFYKIL